MKNVEAFQWNNSTTGQEIEDLVHKMTTEQPLLMRDVLKIGFGDLRNWTNTGYIRDASCGCLVGSCAIAAMRRGMVDLTEVETQWNNRINMVALAPLTLSEAIARGNEQFAQEVDEIGCNVSEECRTVSDEDFSDADFDDEDDREQEVQRYLKDLIATDLRLLGLRVPRQ